MNQPTLPMMRVYLNTIPLVRTDEIITYMQHNDISYRRAKQCITLQLQFPTIWKTTYAHCLKEMAEIKQLTMEHLIDYIKNGYHPEILLKSLLTNETILKDYGACIEHSGSSWAFLSSALYKAGATTNKEEE
jgi:hypothetical protein